LHSFGNEAGKGDGLREGGQRKAFFHCAQEERGVTGRRWSRIKGASRTSHEKPASDHWGRDLVEPFACCPGDEKEETLQYPKKSECGGEKKREGGHKKFNKDLQGD